MLGKKSIKFRPYARLLTMIGEQLIKNERIALIELVKNSYDADATWVKVSFEGFTENFGATENSKIIIEDNGCGMSAEILEKAWANPATPEKKLRKKKKSTTRLGRILQGEKGIGRFAVLKLGKSVVVSSREKGDEEEHSISFDFSMFDEDFVESNEDALFLDDLSISLSKSKPTNIEEKPLKVGKRSVKRPAHGTKIEITNIRGEWSKSKVAACYSDIAKLQSIFPNAKSSNDFSVYFDLNGKDFRFQEEYRERLGFLLEELSVLKITNGKYIEKNREFLFELNGVKQSVKLSDHKITGNSVFRKHFQDRLDVSENGTDCGNFSFEFYVFDLSNNVPSKFSLDSRDRPIVKSNRIYLYRDEIRVYPYGEQDDDWLSIDQYRGTISAGDFLSNDQVVGKIDISQDENPKLRDKTNREGLVDEGNATHDFVGLLKTFLSYITVGPYKRYKEDLKDKNSHDIFKSEVVQTEFDFVFEALEDGDAPSAKKHLVQLQKNYSTERHYLVRRAEQTEDLAGIGLSVETASHDIMAMLGKALVNLDGCISDLSFEDVNLEEVQKELMATRGMLSFVSDQMRDVQLLFRSSKQRRKTITVDDVLEKVERIYARNLKKSGIEYEKNVIGGPLKAKTTDAVILQLLINLFDNSVYWLETSRQQNKHIFVTLDSSSGTLTFSDNGPGVPKEDLPYIFNPFYSGKGEVGRGLGLYIARQLLERHNFKINYAEVSSEKVLSGANFVVDLNGE